MVAIVAENKEYEFWQRDSLAFELTKKETISQKIDHIHYNPTAEKWKLCNDPIDYYYSSAKFYGSGIDDFGFLKHNSKQVRGTRTKAGGFLLIIWINYLLL